MIEFDVPGEPTGKGRPKFSRRGNYVSTYTPEKTVNYENLVKLMFYQTGAEMIEQNVPVVIYLDIVFSIPKSTSNKKRQQMLNGEIFPTKKPDLDNVLKCVADALNGVAFYDDSQVVMSIINKRFGTEPKVHVQIGEFKVC